MKSRQTVKLARAYSVPVHPGGTRTGAQRKCGGGRTRKAEKTQIKNLQRASMPKQRSQDHERPAYNATGGMYEDTRDVTNYSRNSM
eukprot:2432397-Pyramimonas_sp.AAC.1